jgi:hypothetical protein
MEKFGLTALLFIVIFTTGYFGQKLGYTIEGDPHGQEIMAEDWQSADYGLDVVFKFWENIFKDNALGTGVRCMEYLVNFATFRIDGVPDWMAGFCDLFVLLALVLIFTMVRGNA